LTLKHYYTDNYYVTEMMW